MIGRRLAGRRCRRTPAVTAALAALSALFFSCEDERPRRAAGGPRVVEAAAATAATARDTFRATGTVIAEDRIAVSAEGSGRLVEIFVADGERVLAGDLLLRLDDEEQVAALEAAETQRREAELNLQRMSTLEEQGIVSAAELDAAQSRAESARSAFADAEEALEERTMRAPFDGEIDWIDIAVGTYVAAGQELFELATTATPRVRFAVPQGLASVVAPDSRVTLRRVETDEPQSAHVRTVSGFVDPKTRNVEVEAVPVRPDHFRPGEFLLVDVVTGERPRAVFVPETAILRQGPEAYVFRVAEPGRAERVAVATGVRRRGRIEVAGDVAAGDRVVVRGLQDLRDGAPLEVVTPATAASASTPAAAGRPAESERP